MAFFTQMSTHTTDTMSILDKTFCLLGVLTIKVFCYPNKPLILWQAVKCSNHWATWTQMVERRLHMCTCNLITSETVRYSNHWATWTPMVEQRLHMCTFNLITSETVRCFNHWATWTQVVERRLHMCATCINLMTSEPVTIELHNITGYYYWVIY